MHLSVSLSLVALVTWNFSHKSFWASFLLTLIYQWEEGKIYTSPVSRLIEIVFDCFLSKGLIKRWSEIVSSVGYIKISNDIYKIVMFIRNCFNHVKVTVILQRYVLFIHTCIHCKKIIVKLTVTYCHQLSISCCILYYSKIILNQRTVVLRVL